MSAHTARPGSRPRRSPHPATWAAAAAIALLTAACTSTSSPDTAASVVAAASAGGHAPTLTGPGRRSTRRSSPWPSPGTSSSIPA